MSYVYAEGKMAFPMITSHFNLQAIASATYIAFLHYILKESSVLTKNMYLHYKCPLKNPSIKPFQGVERRP